MPPAMSLNAQLSQVKRAAHQREVADRRRIAIASEATSKSVAPALRQLLEQQCHAHEVAVLEGMRHREERRRRA